MTDKKLKSVIDGKTQMIQCPNGVCEGYACCAYTKNGVCIEDTKKAINVLNNQIVENLYRHNGASNENKKLERQINKLKNQLNENKS